MRAQLHRQAARAGQHNVVIMSYDALRSDVDWVASRQWGYAVLDEGHIIRNPKSQISQVGQGTVSDCEELISTAYAHGARCVYMA